MSLSVSDYVWGEISSSRWGWLMILFPSGRPDLLTFLSLDPTSAEELVTLR